MSTEHSGPSLEDMGINPDIGEDYLDIEDLFLRENLKDEENFNSVKEQLDKIRKEIEKYYEAKDKLKVDMDQDQNVDESHDKATRLLENFKINGKVVDINKLTNEADLKGVYNDLIYNVNRYIELSMIGRDKSMMAEMG